MAEIDIRSHTGPAAAEHGWTADDFDAAWREGLQRHGDMFDVVAAVIRSTEAGAHPVSIAQLSSAVERPVREIRQLVDQADAGMPSLRIGHTTDQVWLDFTADRPRFWYLIGDRRIGVAGCGLDIFEVARALQQPMQAEATCPVTGTTITVRWNPDGVAGVEPPEAVITAIHPATVPEAAQLLDAARVDADVCTQQTFFANFDGPGNGWTGIPVAGSPRWPPSTDGGAPSAASPKLRANDVAADRGPLENLNGHAAPNRTTR